MIQDTSLSSRMLDSVIHISLIILVICCLYPVMHVASVSLSSPVEVAKNNVTFYPRGFQLDAYELVLKAGIIPRGFKNSILYTSLGTAVNLIMTVLMAYPLSKKRLTLRGFYTTLVVITMFFSGGLIPTFLLVRSLGMYNTIWALVLPGAIAVWNLIIMRTFFQALPVELEESAYLDGANDFSILVRIVLPLSKAAIATIGLFYMVGHWNSWFPAVIYLRKRSMYPLQVLLREIVILGEMIAEMLMKGDQGRQSILIQDRITNAGIDEYITLEKLKYTTLFVSLIPMLIIYPFIQRYFAKGVMIGSIKG